MLGIRNKLGKWHDFVRRLHTVPDGDTSASKRTRVVPVELDLMHETELRPQEVKKQPLTRISFKLGPFLEMLTEFVKALPDESIVWLTGMVEDGVGVVEKCWKCELEFSSPSEAMVKPEWLVEFMEKLRNFYPEHNLVVEAHNHPIGSGLSSVDEDGLFAITQWNRSLYWVMVACDFRLGAYEAKENDIRRIPWKVEGKWKESS